MTQETALIAALGTITGALLGWVLGSLQERLRWKREDLIRFHDNRRNLYVSFLSETSHAIPLALRNIKSEATIESLRQLYTELRLTASPKVLTETVLLMGALDHYIGSFSWLYHKPKETVDLQYLHHRQNQFVLRVREEFGLPGEKWRRGRWRWPWGNR